MKVLIDFTQIPLQRAGAGVYAENMVRALVPLAHPDDQIVLLMQSDERVLRNDLQGAGNVRILSIPRRLFRNRFALMLFEQIILPWILRVHRIDVLHSLHYTLPLWSPAARVVTFHDMTMILWPQLHTRARRLIMPVYMRLAWKRADAILFVSAATQRDAERIFPPSLGLRAVTPLGVSSDAFLVPPASDVQDALAAVGVSRPFLLFIGTIEPRKNLLRLIHAFETTADRYPDCTLVLAGKLGWEYEPVLRAIASSPVGARICRLGYISDVTKRALVAGCAALVYPSLYEGFGLPVLEGMAAGAPVITSNVSSLPEVAGDAAILVDPESTEALAEALREVLNPSTAELLRKSGPRRAQLFPWSRTAVETWKAYKMACLRRRGPSRPSPGPNTTRPS